MGYGICFTIVPEQRRTPTPLNLIKSALSHLKSFVNSSFDVKRHGLRPLSAAGAVNSDSIAWVTYYEKLACEALGPWKPSINGSLSSIFQTSVWCKLAMMLEIPVSVHQWHVWVRTKSTCGVCGIGVVWACTAQPAVVVFFLRKNSHESNPTAFILGRSSSLKLFCHSGLNYAAWS